MSEKYESYGFYQWKLPLQENQFHELSSSIHFENIGKGRQGNHLVKVQDDFIPLVRTTSQYDTPAYNFSDTHNSIADHISDFAKTKLNLSELFSFNNALIEIYDKSYTKMKYHSDQALDLDPNSYVALFSCYEHSEALEKPLIRRLKVRDKTTLKEREFLLEQNSVILFSMATNSRYQHKIVLDTSTNKRDTLEENKWLGITFRKSKTRVQFRDNRPYFENGKELTLANEEQRRTFFKLRGQENKSLDFEYPFVDFTLSKSDLMLPIEY